MMKATKVMCSQCPISLILLKKFLFRTLVSGGEGQLGLGAQQQRVSNQCRWGSEIHQCMWQILRNLGWTLKGAICKHPGLGELRTANKWTLQWAQVTRLKVRIHGCNRKMIHGGRRSDMRLWWLRIGPAIAMRYKMTMAGSGTIGPTSGLTAEATMGGQTAAGTIPTTRTTRTAIGTWWVKGATEVSIRGGVIPTLRLTVMRTDTMAMAAMVDKVEMIAEPELILLDKGTVGKTDQETIKQFGKYLRRGDGTIGRIGTITKTVFCRCRPKVAVQGRMKWSCSHRHLRRLWHRQINRTSR